MHARVRVPPLALKQLLLRAGEPPRDDHLAARARDQVAQIPHRDVDAAAGVDPREYLADVLPRLTGRIRLVDLPSLLPSRWAAQRASVTTTAGVTVAQP